MNAIDLLEGIEKVSGRKEKEELLGQADEWTKAFLQWALDPYRTYGLQNIPSPTPRDWEYDCTEDDIFPACATQLMFILDELQNRKLVGKEAREVVNQFLSEVPNRTAKWFHRIILKDLSCGITEKTVNKVFPGLIPSFSVQLAEDVSGNAFTGRQAAKISYPVWCDYKLDGLRMIAIKEGGIVTLYSRKGHVIETLPSLQALLADTTDDFMLDGEVMGRSWNESQSTVFATKNTVDDEHMFYNVFDGMRLAEWKTQKCLHPYRLRREFIRHIIGQVAHPRVRTVGGKVIDDREGIAEFYKQALADGHEGIMIKDQEALYAFKRSKAVLKMKPSATWEGIIVGWEKGDPNGKWKDKFGAFQVKFDGVLTSVGGGYTDELREQFTQEGPQIHVGKIVEVKGQEMTKDGVIRFPVFVRFRHEGDK